MFKHYFERISTEIAIYPLLSLGIFFLFFLGLLVWVLKADKVYMEKMKKIPLD